MTPLSIVLECDLLVTAMEQRDRKLPKSQRLLKNPEFVRIQKIGRRFHCKQFILIVAQAAEMDKTSTRAKSIKNSSTEVKLGITITKKIEPTSVKRNRVKRIVRAAFRQIKNSCLPGIVILVIAKHGSADLKTPEVQRQFLGALKFNGYLKPT